MIFDCNKTKLQKLNDRRIALQNKLDELKPKYDAIKLTTKLKKSGRLTPIAANRLEGDLESMSTSKDRQVALRMLKGVLPVSDQFKTFNRNTGALNFEKAMSMSSKEQKETANGFVEALKSMGVSLSQKESENKVTPTAEVSTTVSFSAQEEAAKAEAVFSKDDLSRCVDLVEKGSYSELKTFFSKFADVDCADESEEDDEEEEKESEDDTEKMSALFAEIKEVKTALKAVEESMVALSSNAQTSAEVLTLVSDKMNQSAESATTEEDK